MHGDERSSRVVGTRVAEIELPEGASIGAIVRGDEVIMAHHDTRRAAPTITSSCSSPTAGISRRSSGCSCASPR